MNIESKIQDIANQWIGDSDKFLVELKITAGKVGVFVDKPDGITIEECMKLSRMISRELEEDGVFESRELVVSSPGIMEPFQVPQQFSKNIGREIQVTRNDGTVSSGKLTRIEDDKLMLTEEKTIKVNKKKKIEENHMTIPMSEVNEAKLVMNFKSK
jgi:ribosome maturation factor RimP